jgi:predicted Zn-dependent protease
MRALGIVVVAALLLLSAIVTAHAQPRSDPPLTTGPTSETDRLRTEIEEVARLFGRAEHDAVVRKTEDAITRHGLTSASLSLLLYQAESRYRLGRREDAIRAYESALPVISRLDNVGQRRFAPVFFRLGLLTREQRRLDVAVARLEAGLRLEPQSTYFQILLGELFSQQGDRVRALAHFKEVAASSFPTNEERAVLGMKIDRLTAGKVGASVRPPDVRTVPVHLGVSIGLIALNDLPKDVVLADVCVVLRTEFRIPCQVLAPFTIPEDIFVADRAQYDGNRLVDELRRRFPEATRPHRYLIGVTGRDLFGPKTNYVFSWQHRTADAGTGVISAFRFAAALDDFYESSAVLGRRLAIQTISTLGSMLGFTRPTNPECAMAFPIDFREFQQKRVKLCQTDVEQRDAMLRARGGATKVLGEAGNREVDRVYRAYHLE